MYLHHTLSHSLGGSPSCLSPSPFIPPLSYLKSHITASLYRRAARAQGIVARPTACGRMDRQMDMPGLLVPGSWLLFLAPVPVPDARAGARWLARWLAGWPAGSGTRQISRQDPSSARLRRHQNLLVPVTRAESQCFSAAMVSVTQWGSMSSAVPGLSSPSRPLVACEM